ncbi:MAG: hypothetical protein ACP5NU_02080 [Methanomicrobiales archaeon]|jgi:hypothetical protein|nr:hypothetical protein [Burkholderiaceae bacterium]NLH26297.1 hypothetical protein [Methanomicrobiales archaeon]HNO07869.1 hypothetical protein [Methanoregulaceae archaeon]HPA07006.1 hypothetical protein [Methanoregulaceae archaeon]HPS22902.1 hypothetical protein [Methanoregulaceae archaeon]
MKNTDHIPDMIDRVKVPRKVYQELMMINREIHYPDDYPLAVKKADNNGFIHAAEWLKKNEELYKRGFVRGFEPAD